MNKLGRNILAISVGGVITGVGIALALRSLLRTRRVATTTTPTFSKSDELCLPDGSPVRPSTARTDVALISLESYTRSITFYTSAESISPKAPPSQATEPGASSDQTATTETPQAMADGAQGNYRQWVGNMRTRIYHRLDGHFLPSESNREYFASEDDALQAGYRRAANE